MPLTWRMMIKHFTSRRKGILQNGHYASFLKRAKSTKLNSHHSHQSSLKNHRRTCRSRKGCSRYCLKSKQRKFDQIILKINGQIMTFLVVNDSSEHKKLCSFNSWSGVTSTTFTKLFTMPSLCALIACSCAKTKTKTKPRTKVFVQSRQCL